MSSVFLQLEKHCIITVIKVPVQISSHLVFNVSRTLSVGPRILTELW